METEVRIRKKKCKIEFEAQEKAPQDPKHKFIIYFYAYLDKAIQSAVEKSQTKWKKERKYAKWCVLQPAKLTLPLTANEQKSLLHKKEKNK